MREGIIATIRNNAAALGVEGVTSLAIFGSRVRGDASFSLLNLIGVEHIIGDATGLPAQATMRRSIPPRFAERNANDVGEVF